MNEEREILLLPGMDGTGDLLAPFARALNRTRRARVLSYPPDRRLGYDDLVEHVVPRLPAAPCILLGESFSGPIAIEIAARHPDRVAGLILASSFVRHPAPSLLALGTPLLDPRFIPMGLVAWLLLGRNQDRIVTAALHRALRQVAPSVLAHRASQAPRVDKRAALRRTRCPLLCLHGRDDRLVGIGHLARITEERSDAQVVLLDAPHMLLETHVEEAVRCVDAFCAAMTAAASG